MQDYLGDIKTEDLSGGLWTPDKQWNRMHGDGKSTTGGNYHIETMQDSSGKYIAKIAGAPDSSPVIIAAAGEAQPSFQGVVDGLKAKFA